MHSRAGVHCLTSVEAGWPRPGVLALIGLASEFQACVDKRPSGSLLNGLTRLAAGCGHLAARSFLTDLSYVLTYQLEDQLGVHDSALLSWLPASFHSLASIQSISSIHPYQSIQISLNGNATATMWQDVNVSDEQELEPGSGGASSPSQPPIPDAAQVEILKALAAPTRLRIMYALEVGDTKPRVMSVKELAEELGEPQTRLYRHIKVLESAGLIEVAATRMVSGILEQRYRATGRDLLLSSGLARVAPEAAEAATNTMVHMFTQQFFAAYREGRVPEGEDIPEGEAYRRPKLMISAGRISPTRATSIRSRLEKIIDEIGLSEDPDGVPVNILIGFYSPSEPDKS